MYLLEILAGVMIAIGCVVSTSAANALGMILFATGLNVIKEQKLRLFTGKAMYIVSKEETFSSLLHIVLFNFLGTFIVAAVMRGVWNGADYLEIASARTNISWLSAIFGGIFCGLLVSAAVESSSVLATYAYVGTFLICGFPHCIAYSFYFWIAVFNRCAVGSMLAKLIVVVISNFIGCCTFRFVRSLLQQEVQKEDE